MLYQKLLPGHDPYYVIVRKNAPFQRHYHHEIELAFCINGSDALSVGNNEYRLQSNDLAIINSMALHEYRDAPTEGYRLILELGPDLLGDRFSAVTADRPDCEILRPNGELLSLLQETADACRRHTAYSDLLIKGNVYKIAARLMRDCWSDAATAKDPRDIRGIEKALEIIYNRYREPLDIDTVSRECGYEKSNFCKIFKRSTGETFHKLLNRHRIDVACTLLSDPTLSVEQVAFSVGFSDVKSFCRVFKATKGETASQFRKTLTPTTAP